MANKEIDLYSKDLTQGGQLSPQEDPASVYADEIQKAASEKNYKALLQADIAAYNLKRQTQKYLGNELAMQGLGNQGYGTTAHVGIENQAQNLYAQNLANYNLAQADAATQAQKRAEDQSLDNDKELTSWLQGVYGDPEGVAEQMGNYGYVQDADGKWYKKDADGNPDKTRPASSYVSAAASDALRQGNAAANYGNQSNSKIVAGARSALQNWASKYEGVDQNGYASATDLGEASVGRLDNSGTGKLKDVVGNELKALESRIKTGTIADGTMFKLQRGGGHGEAYLVLYLDGKLYLVSDDDREQEENQVASRYNMYQGPKEELKGK